MDLIILGIIVLVNLFLQSTLLNSLAIFGVTANTSLIILVSLIIIKKKPYATVVALVMGLIQDILYSDIIGISALVYFLLTYLVEGHEKKLNRDNLLIPVFLTALMTVLYNFLKSILLYFLMGEWIIGSYFYNKLAIELIYNVVLTIPIYMMMSKIFVAPTNMFMQD